MQQRELTSHRAVDFGIIFTIFVCLGIVALGAWLSQYTLEAPPPALNLTTTLQRRAWTAVVAHAGRPVRTGLLARGLGLTREHLSRKFAASDGPNLKRVIDLVRVLAAAELAKNPGYDVADVAVSGRLVMQDRKILTVDEGEVLENADAVYRRFVERAGIERYTRDADCFWGRSRTK